jgi:putative tryptophan/tyrosine transport system substrate-binding protein
VTIMHQEQIAELAIMHRLPAMFPGGFTAGGVISYGTTILDTLARLPAYVHAILNGAKPGDLPIEVTTRRELIFNLKTARAIGVTVPPDLLKRADQVISAV